VGSFAVNQRDGSMVVMQLPGWLGFGIFRKVSTVQEPHGLRAFNISSGGWSCSSFWSISIISAEYLKVDSIVHWRGGAVWSVQKTLFKIPNIFHFNNIEIQSSKRCTTSTMRLFQSQRFSAGNKILEKRATNHSQS
jgi:hypothetical protein